MLLRPRKFSFKNRQKKRKFRPSKFHNTKLVYGHFGLQVLQPLRLTSRHIFRYKIFLKKGSKRTDKTRRGLWINIFPHLPLTKKVIGSRMGKGKGKLSTWFSQIPAGTILFEFKNLRVGRAKYFFREMKHRLPVKTTFIASSDIQIYAPTNYTKPLTFQSLW